MINLINAGAKRDLKAARTNIVLLTYCVVVAMTLFSVLVLVIFSHWWLSNKVNGALSDQAKNDAQTSSYNDVREQAASFSANLSKIQSTLTNRSHYSTALLNIAASLPAGASVTAVTFSPTFITTPLEISATTPTNASAIALGDALAKSPIYSKVVVNNVNCAAADTTGCIVSITATMKQNIFEPGATE